MKYFIVKIINDRDIQLEEPFIFSESFSHLGIFAAIFAGNEAVEILGAGFVSVVDGRAICHGKSESLDVRSRPGKDSRLISAMLTES